MLPPVSAAPGGTAKSRCSGRAGALPAISGNEETPISFTVTATDPDGDVLAFSLAGEVPAGAAIDAATGLFHWTPAEAQGPALYRFSIRVSDGRHSVAEAVEIVVHEVNQAPVFTSDPVLAARQGEAYEYQLTAADADLPQNSLSFQALEIPGWLHFDAATQMLSGTPDGDVQSISSIRLQVSDGQETALQEFVLQVEFATGLFGYDRREGAGISVYPNPAKGSIVVKLDDVADQEQVKVSLRTLDGRLLVQAYGYLSSGMEIINLHLAKAGAGAYLLQVQTKHKLSTARLVKIN